MPENPATAPETTRPAATEYRYHPTYLVGDIMSPLPRPSCQVSFAVGNRAVVYLCCPDEDGRLTVEFEGLEVELQLERAGEMRSTTVPYDGQRDHIRSIGISGEWRPRHMIRSRKGQDSYFTIFGLPEQSWSPWFSPALVDPAQPPTGITARAIWGQESTPTAPQTSEQREALQRQAEERQRQRQEEAHIREVAQSRSRDMLMSHLTTDQKKCFDVWESFMVRGSQGGLYEVTDESSTNVRAYEGEAAGGFLCIICPDVPIYDQMLGLKLLIETDEERFLEIAEY